VLLSKFKYRIQPYLGVLVPRRNGISWVGDTWNWKSLGNVHKYQVNTRVGLGRILV
jgi:hypothetical protein